MTVQGRGGAGAQRRSRAQREADKERRQQQWAESQARKVALIDTAYAAANDYMLSRYDRAMVDERWVSPRGPNETHSSYYQRRGRHQAQIEQLARPLRARAANGRTLRPSSEAYERRGTRPLKPCSNSPDSSSSSSSTSSNDDSDSSLEDYGESFKRPGVNGASEDNGQVLTTLQQAAAEGDEDMVRLLLARGVNVNGKEGDVSDETALHVAAHVGHLEIVDMLLKDGAHVDDFDLQGQTPLHAAATSGQAGVARMLLLHGARLNCVDTAGDTPLHCAARYARTEVVRVLIRGVGRARSGRGVQARSRGGVAWHEAQWALSAKNKQGKTPAELSELGPDGGDAVSAVLAEFTATQSAAKAESELRASTATLNSLSSQLKEREEECALLKARLQSQEAGALVVQQHLQSVQAKAKAANEARLQALDDLQRAETRIEGLTEDLAASHKERRAATGALAAAAASRTDTSTTSTAEAELATLRSQVRSMVRAHVSRMLTTCPRHGATFDGHQDPFLPAREQTFRCGCSVLLHQMQPPTKALSQSLPDDTRAADLQEEHEYQQGQEEGMADPRHRQPVADMLHAERAKRGLVGARIVGLKPQWCSCKEGNDHAYKSTVAPEELHGATVAESAALQSSRIEDESGTVAMGSAVASVRWMGAKKCGWGAGGGAPKNQASRHRRSKSATIVGGGSGAGSATPFERWGYRVTS